MRSAKNDCFRMLSLLLTFRKGFRKPSGTFRNAGFEHLTYRLYLQDQLGDQILLLTSPTCEPDLQDRSGHCCQGLQKNAKGTIGHK